MKLFPIQWMFAGIFAVKAARIAKTNPLRMPPASAEHFCVCESNMAAQDGALTTKL